MKNEYKLRYFSFSAALVILILSSCKDTLYVEPAGQQTVDATFTDFSGALAATNGIYSTLTRTVYKNTSLISIDQASDDVIYGPKGTPNYSSIDYFENTPTTSFLFDIWSGFYTVIYRANVVIDRMPGVSFPTNTSKNSAGLPFSDQFAGEAKFLRAFAYFNLVRIYGDIPMHVKEIKSVSEINIPRTPVAEVYRQIEKDLNDAVTLLPPKYSGSGVGNEIGRVTKWAAYAMLADVYLTQKKFAEAKEAANKVITEGGSYGLKLNDDYKNNFLGRGGTDNSPESLFEIQFGGATVSGPGANGNGFATFMSGSDNNPVGYAMYRPSDNSYTENEPGFTNGLIQAFDKDNDKRFNVCFYSGRGDGANMRMLTWKHYKLGTGSGNENYPVYRFSEMYLIYAEASNELAGPDAKSIDYVNYVRRRGYGLPVTTSSLFDISAAQTKDSFRDKIRAERRLELAMENKRWFDLLRYGYDYMNNVLVTMQKRDKFKKEYMLFPLPSTELIANELLVQNPGY